MARFGGAVVDRLIGTDDDEILTILFIGLAVLVAGLAEELGVSDAIGAFLAGLIVAETTVKARVEHLVLPLRDAFAAIFFFTFGLTIDPGEFGDVAGPVLAGRRPVVRAEPPRRRRWWGGSAATTGGPPPTSASPCWPGASSR